MTSRSPTLVFFTRVPVTRRRARSLGSHVHHHSDSYRPSPWTVTHSVGNAVTVCRYHMARDMGEHGSFHPAPPQHHDALNSTPSSKHLGHGAERISSVVTAVYARRMMRDPDTMYAE